MNNIKYIILIDFNKFLLNILLVDMHRVIILWTKFEKIKKLIIRETFELKIFYFKLLFILYFHIDYIFYL